MKVVENNTGLFFLVTYLIGFSVLLKVPSFYFNVGFYNILFVISYYLILKTMPLLCWENIRRNLCFVAIIFVFLLPTKYFFGKILSTTPIALNFEFITISLMYAPIIEELLFRDIWYRNIANYFSGGYIKAAIYSSIVFTLFHGAEDYWIYMPIFFMSLVYTFVYAKTKNILMALLVHFYWNILGVYW